MLHPVSHRPPAPHLPHKGHKRGPTPWLLHHMINGAPTPWLLLLTTERAPNPLVASPGGAGVGLLAHHVKHLDVSASALCWARRCVVDLRGAVDA